MVIPLQWIGLFSVATVFVVMFALGLMLGREQIEAACRFVRATGKRAAIGELADLSRIIAGEAGTTIAADASGIVYAP